MKIIAERPPVYDAIVAAGLKPTDATIFAYAPDIYFPAGLDLPAELVIHEAVHICQQNDIGGPDIWWARYIEDPAFRLQQELEAYRAQIASHADRARRRECMRRVAKTLASPMYGFGIRAEQARELLKATG